MSAYRRIAWLAIVALVASVQSAHADRIAIETFVGTRSPDADHVMAVFRPLLEKHHFVADPSILQKMFAEHAWRPGTVDPKFSGDKFAKAVESGIGSYVDLDFDKAAKTLGAAIKSARANPIYLAREPKYRDLMMRALLYDALARGRQGDDDQRRADGEKKQTARDQLAKDADEAAADRDETMTELIRSYPTKVIVNKDFGHEAEQLFQRIRKTADKQGRGRLEITVSDPDAVIYVDEVVHERKTAIGDLVPGPYRVLVESPSGEARQYQVELLANQLSRLNIDWDLDSMLGLDGPVAIRDATEKEHTREAEFVVKLARQATNATLLATFTVKRANHHLVVSGTAYNAFDGKLGPSGQVELTGRDDQDALDQLLDHLDGKSAGRVTTLEHPEYIAPPAETLAVPPPPREAIEDHPPPERAISSAIPKPVENAMTTSSPTDVSRRDQVDHPYLIPAAVVGTGLAAVGVGLYVSFTVKPNPAGVQKPNLYSPAGIGLQIGGGVVGAVGLYLAFRAWRHEHSAHVAPAVTITEHDMTIGWASDF